MTAPVNLQQIKTHIKNECDSYVTRTDITARKQAEVTRQEFELRCWANIAIEQHIDFIQKLKCEVNELRRHAGMPPKY